MSYVNIISFPTKGKAEQVLNELQQIEEKYGFVRYSDLNERLDPPIENTSADFTNGWRDTHEFSIYIDTTGDNVKYAISVPEGEYIGDLTSNQKEERGLVYLVFEKSDFSSEKGCLLDIGINKNMALYFAYHRAKDLLDIMTDDDRLFITLSPIDDRGYMLEDQFGNLLKVLTIEKKEIDI